MTMKKSGLQHRRLQEVSSSGALLSEHGSHEHTQEPSSEVAESERWRNYRTRCIWGAIMIMLFALLLMVGPMAVIFLVVVIQTAVFKEVIGIAHMRYRERKLAWFRTINWFGREPRPFY